VSLFDSDRFFGRECAFARMSLFLSECSMHLLIGRCAVARVSLFVSDRITGHEWAVDHWVLFCFCYC